MTVLVFVFALIAAVSAAPQGYGMPSASGGAQVNSRVFLFEVPANNAPISRPRNIPKPKVNRNIVFVRIPEAGQGPQPVVVPPPRQEHVVYVLNKQTQQNQQMIEMPAPPPSDPEVYFVNYADGENPSLPIGVDLQTALNSASQGSGQNVGGGGSGGGFGGGLGGGIGGGGGIVAGSPSSLYTTP